jgi:glucose-1-phosphate thymidylyltransferase
MRGIILAGGRGSRLAPLTSVINKQLLPVYDKPVVYYPLSTLMLAGIREILIITAPDYEQSYRQLLGDGSRWGLRIEYCIQPSPDGLAQAFLLGKDFIKDQPCCLILGDNILYGHGLSLILKEEAKLKQGACVFGYWVRDPKPYGVVTFDAGGHAIAIEEKPEVPKSNYAVMGLYFYDGNVAEYAAQLKPSARGELEITDLNNLYLKKGQLKVRPLGRGIAWLDVGTHDQLLQAGQFVRTIEERQGLKIACLEEIAYRMGLIDREKLKVLADGFTNEYREYLHGVISGHQF